MTITFEQLGVVHDELQSLNFDLAVDRTTKTESEQRYLEHYDLPLPEELGDTSHCLGFIFAASFKIAVHYWLPESPRGTYFIVHGYFDHTGLYGHLIRHLLSQGYAVVAFDLPGHGLSSGERVSIKSFDDYVDVFSALLDHCSAHFPKPWNAVGQSTGGAILIKYVMAALPKNYKNELNAVTVLAPLIHPRGWKKSLYVYKLFHRFLKKIKRKLSPNSANKAFNRFLINSDPLQTFYVPMAWIASMKRWTEEFAALPPSDYPLTVIQGDCDRTVDWEYNLNALQSKFSNIDIEIIAGVQHHMVNETDELRRRIFEKID